MVLRQTELAEKQVELLTQAFPDKTRCAVLLDEKYRTHGASYADSETGEAIADLSRPP